MNKALVTVTDESLKLTDLIADNEVLRVEQKQAVKLYDYSREVARMPVTLIMSVSKPRLENG